jgi:putative adhesin
MKIERISLLMGWMVCFAQFPSNAQEFKEHISKEFTPAASHAVLAVYNISGSVKVVGYAGNKVIFDIDKTISAKSSDELEAGKKEFRLEFDQMGDTVEAYIAEPNDSRPHSNWHDRRIKYHYNLEFTIKVPFNMNLCLSAVNNGDINVSDVTGVLDLSNVNGSISVSGARGVTDAHTVNGDVTVAYTTVPPDASSYNTVNGDLRVTYPSGLSADLEFKSLNGNFYTDFGDVEILPFKVIKSGDKNDGGTVYKLDKNSNFRFGKGGKIFKFETLNGNVYIKKQS